MNMRNLIRQVFVTLKKRITLLGYDEYTIAEYFRKQGARIGAHSRIFIESFGSEPYLVRIGDNCTIAEGVSFITHDGSMDLFRREIPQLNVFDRIVIKDNCFIGVGAKILYGVTIGPNAIIGTGAVVTKDIPPNVVAAGVPARVISTLAAFKEKSIARWRALGLQGDRSTWRRQLTGYFWPAGKENA